MFRIGFDIKDIESKYRYDSTLQILPPFDQIFENVPLLQRSYELDPSGEQYSVYAEARWQPMDALVLDFGLRWDRQTYSVADGNEQRSPRVNALYHIGKRTELRLGAGRFYQAQEINELQVEDGFDTFFAPQFADHVVAGLVHRFESGPSLRVEWYQKDYDRPAPRFENAFDTLVLIPELQIDRVRIDADRAFVKGLELSVTSRENSDVLWWAGYAWSSTEDTVNGVEVSRSWDERHSLKAGFSTNWRSWDVSVAGAWHSGWPKTTLIVDTILLPDGTTELTATTSPRNRQSYADFHSLDVRASRSIALSQGELTTFMEVSNLYNRRNPCCTRYTMQTAADGSQLVDAKQNHWLPLVPSIGVVWKF
jgi:outer membrane receptor protein involved in Fe transport